MLAHRRLGQARIDQRIDAEHAVDEAQEVAVATQDRLVGRQPGPTLQQLHHGAADEHETPLRFGQRVAHAAVGMLVQVATQGALVAGARHGHADHAGAVDQVQREQARRCRDQRRGIRLERGDVVFPRAAVTAHVAYQTGAGVDPRLESQSDLLGRQPGVAASGGIGELATGEPHAADDQHRDEKECDRSPRLQTSGTSWGDTSHLATRRARYCRSVPRILRDFSGSGKANPRFRRSVLGSA